MSIGGKFDKVSVEDTLAELKTDPDKGLTSEEAKTRLAQYGENALEENRESAWAKLFSFFWGPIPWMIEVAAILSAALHRWPDLIMILALLFINAALGFVQEFKADNAIQALKDSLALKARAMRDGKWTDIDAKTLVPGDIVMVKLGNILPADLKLVSGEYLSVDQSALTGESLPVDKQKGDSAYSGTIAKLGEMNGVVTETGMETFFGKTARLVDTAKTKSHFQQAICKIGNFLIGSTMLVCAIIFFTDLYRIYVEHSNTETLGSLVIFILVIVIAGIPVALPAVLSVTMAVGASRLAKLKAIVAKLTAIEEIAGMDILCSDKTGTLTKNQLTVHETQLFAEKETHEDVLLIAALASKPDSKDAIDDAIIDKLGKPDLLKGFAQEKLIPFDPVRKRIEATVKGKDGKEMLCVKGAPQIVLDLTDPKKALRDKVMASVDEFAGRGFRTLGVARQVDGKWTFLGLIPLFDPPRDDTLDTLRHAKDLGVVVKMVTGDHTAIARELSGQLELGTNICPVGKMFADEITPDMQDKMLSEADGFAEVFPEHKFNIVKALQARNHITGMTGDGVNDAPALKQADIGIAVSGATDAARAAADLVLTQPGLLTISHAIEEARRIFGRMKSYAMYRISETVRLLLFLLLAMLVYNAHPLTAIMIIFIALLNDLPIMMIAYDNMPIDKKPVTWQMREVLVVATGVAIAGVISTFGLYWIGENIWHMNAEHLRTLSFMAILCGGNLTIYITRNTGMLWAKPYPEWKFFWATIFSVTVGTFASVYGLGTKDFIGIGWHYVGLSWAYIAVWFIICMLVKVAIYKVLGHESSYHVSYLEKQTDQHLHNVGL